MRFALQNLQRNFPTRSENQGLFDALNEAYAGDTDEDEKEFLRLAAIKQSQILDEWKQIRAMFSSLTPENRAKLMKNAKLMKKLSRKLCSTFTIQFCF